MGKSTENDHLVVNINGELPDTNEDLPTVKRCPGITPARGAAAGVVFFCLTGLIILLLTLTKKNSEPACKSNVTGALVVDFGNISNTNSSGSGSGITPVIVSGSGSEITPVIVSSSGSSSELIQTGKFPCDRVVCKEIDTFLAFKKLVFPFMESVCQLLQANVSNFRDRECASKHIDAFFVVAGAQCKVGPGRLPGLSAEGIRNKEQEMQLAIVGSTPSR